MRALLLLACAGCTQILGLHDTKLVVQDAALDAAGVCAGAPACTSTTGRSLCGQLVQTGASAGMPLQVAAPTGGACAGSDGPCAFTVYGEPATSLFAGSATGRVAGAIDDCGRFVVPDLDPSISDAAVVVIATTALESASLVLGRPTTPGTDTGVAVYAVPTAVATQWGMQLSTTSPPSITSGYLVTHVDANGTPQATEALRVGGAPVNAPATTPWGAYFSGEAPFGALDATATQTGASGSALLVPSAGTFTLSAARPGKTCTPVMLQSVANAIVHVELHC